MRVDIGDGVRLFFDVEGALLRPNGPRMSKKPTLLLLHGGPGYDHSFFKPLFSRLADVAQVVYLDHRGNGRSSRSQPEHWNMARWGDDVVAFCDSLEIEKPVVLGSSFGGTVAMSYATRHPDHPLGLILSNTAACRRADLILAAFERLGGARLRDVARRYLETPNAETEEAYLRECHPFYSRAEASGRYNFRESTERTVRNPEVTYYYANDRQLPDGTVLPGEAKRINLLPALERVRCPTLIMGGTDDPITPLEGMRSIAQAIGPSARVVEFPRCGHTLSADEPNRYVAEIRAFIIKLGT